MKLKYEAVDGTQFDTEKECEDYENTLIKLYDREGEPLQYTHEGVDAAKIIYLHNVAMIIDFEEFCDKYGLMVAGFDKSETGWFYWDFDTWVHIPADAVKAFQSIKN